MVSSQNRKVVAAYPKALSGCKLQFPDWPTGTDTERETALKQRISSEGATVGVAAELQQLVYAFFQEHGRNLPWRQAVDPFLILVSEVMLQQTQVDRVIPKYRAFVERFPTPESLAAASLTELLSYWQGLGYNRRAMNLQRAARILATEWDGQVPQLPDQLQQLPGIGPYTAGAIAAFAFNRPELFLETNIRAVLLHFFFADQADISDRELLPFAGLVLDYNHPRIWYSALMDYGSDLKRRFPNPGRRSRHHSNHSRFEGSDRQLRGAIVRLVLGHGGLTSEQLAELLPVAGDRQQRIVAELVQEGFLSYDNQRIVIP